MIVPARNASISSAVSDAISGSHGEPARKAKAVAQQTEVADDMPGHRGAWAQVWVIVGRRHRCSHRDNPVFAVSRPRNAETMSSGAMRSR